jgi:hypothetical protein
MTQQTHIGKVPDKVLYKYLDVDGAKAMLSNCNIQFTNATKLNDPLDCHPGLVCNAKEVSYAPYTGAVALRYAGVSISELGYYPSPNRYLTYVCSLSMIFDSILMWSYYTKNHQGVCIGIDMPELNKCFKFIDFYVEYPEKLTKYSWAPGKTMKAFKHQLATKAPDWKHEKEVRLLLFPEYSSMSRIDHYHRRPISGTCFNSIYLGVNMDGKDMEDIIALARQLNPNVKIYKMQVNPDEFKLKDTPIPPSHHPRIC